MRIKITLKRPDLEQCVHMRSVRGLETPDDFEGLDFGSVDDAHWDGKFYCVALPDGTLYAYHEDSIARIAVYPDVVNLQPVQGDRPL